jgi:hypothetical protein
MKHNASEIKILITRSIPDIGIELLRKEGFSLTIWPHDRPMPASEMIEEGKSIMYSLLLLPILLTAIFLLPVLILI